MHRLHYHTTHSLTMASSLHYLIFFFFLLTLSYADQHTHPHQHRSFKPSALVLPLHRDAATHLYVANIHKRTPELPIPFVIDLNGRFLWVNCDQHYLSSTYHAPRCHSTQCSMANTHVCRTCSSQSGSWCHNNTCTLIPSNPVTHKTAPGELAEDVLAIQSLQGSNPGPAVTVPRFLFGCAPASLLQGPLPTGTQGFAGFGRNQISLPSQLAAHFGFKQKFALCLATNGVIFFGDGPYLMEPGLDVSQSLTNTPLIISRQGEYFIGVTSIRINDKNVPLNTSLLPIHPRGHGGTKISTVLPYTVLESSIFRAVTQFFQNELSGVARVAPIAPFGLCFDAQRCPKKLPDIDLVLHKNNVVWRLSGPNLMTPAGKNGVCLAIVDGGVNTKAAIVIGAHQLEENLLQFDLSTSNLGFSSSLLDKRTSCAKFNFTTHV